jgi:hypothetical protein
MSAKILCSVILMACCGSTASAGIITIDSFAGPSDLNLSGPFFLAANVGSGTSAGDLTVGNANFLHLSLASNGTGGLATLDSAAGDLDPFASLPIYTGGTASDNANLGTIMHSLSYALTVPMQVTIHQLTPNTQYEIQVFISENFWQRQGIRHFGLTINGEVVLAADSDIVGLADYPNGIWAANPTRGVIASYLFTTGAMQTGTTIETIVGTSGDMNAYFNAFTVRALPPNDDATTVPEPSSIIAFGGIALCCGLGRWWHRRRAKLAA